MGPYVVVKFDRIFHLILFKDRESSMQIIRFFFSTFIHLRKYFRYQVLGCQRVRVEMYYITYKYGRLCLMNSSHIWLILIDHLIKKSIWVWHVKPIWSLNLSCLTKGQFPLFNTSKFMVFIKLFIPNCWFFLENQLFKGIWLVKMHTYDTTKKNSSLPFGSQF